MAPKTSVAPSAARANVSSASAPYARRAAGQPKSTRQQFSACGACRMRRVRCDLKDLPLTSTGHHPACSNCSERGIKCVDEFAEVKAVKLLRRGRRLQQVEAVYGKVSDDEPALSVPSAASSSSHMVSHAFIASPSPFGPSSNHQHPHSPIIPQLKLEFLSSHFFRRFSIQRPVIEPTEFTARYFAHAKGTSVLSIEGQILAMVLVTWAASFGVDEYGVEHEAASYSSPSSPISVNGHENDNVEKCRARLARTEAMVKEILALIDRHGILRRPTWDGAKVLMLILPLSKGVQSPMDRLTMYQITLTQVCNLCSLASPSTANSGQGPYGDALVRMRLFWYAFVHEGVTIGLTGGRFTLRDDDLAAFKTTLPLQYSSSSSAPLSSNSSTSNSSAPSPVSYSSSIDLPEFGFGVNQTSALDLRGHGLSGHPRASMAYMMTAQYFTLSLNLSAVCRRIHAVLTGSCARSQMHHPSSGGVGTDVDEDGLKDIWDGLDRSWDEFENLRRGTTGTGVGIIRGEDTERFASGWQVFIFECHNVIREALKQRIISHSRSMSHSPSNSPAFHSSASPPLSGSSSSSSTPGYSSATQTALLRMHACATAHCRTNLPRVLAVFKRHLAAPSSGFFAYDAGLIKDGTFFAGLLLAQGDLDADQDIQMALNNNIKAEWGEFDLDSDLSAGISKDRDDTMSLGNGLSQEYSSQYRWSTSFNAVNDAEEGLEICLRALGEMRWAFSKSGERERSIQQLWDARMARESDKRREKGRRRAEYAGGPQQQQAPAYRDGSSSSYLLGKAQQRPSASQSHLSSSAYTRRDQLHSLNLLPPGARPLLPPLAVGLSSLHGDSAPNTACTDDGSGTGSSSSWSTYTPPTTSGSMATATTHRSLNSPGSLSPPLHHLSTPASLSAHHLSPIHQQGSFKTENDLFYTGVSDLDPFSFSVDDGTSGVLMQTNGIAPQTWASTTSLYHGQHQEPHQSSMDGGYLDSSVDFTSSDGLLATGNGTSDENSHFGTTFYH